ncbi:MAG: OmpW family outer membrane protein [Pseudomonadota bacterium]
MRALKTIAAVTLLGSTAQLHAHQAGDLMVRAGIANVDPDASSSALVLDGTAIGSSEADVDDNTQLGLTFTYMLSDNWAIDVLASTPFTHDISAFTGDLGLGTVDAGETSHLPPTVSLMWFPAQPGSAFQPYLGVGVNYTIFFEEDVDSELEGVLGSGSLELDDSVGLALQAGFDYRLTENMYLNAGVRWIDIDTDAEFEFDNNRITTDVDIDPFVYMVAVGWKF